MVTAARARQVLQEGTIASHRAARAPARSAARHAGTLTTQEITTRELVVLIVQGSALALASLIVLAGIWYFAGDHLRARFTSIGSGAGGAAGASSGPAAPGPTLFYRDRGDGTVLVMEIDGNGTRIRGSINRTEVPMLQESHASRNKWDTEGGSAQNRMNALGSSFR